MKRSAKAGDYKSPFKHAPWKADPTMLISEAQYDLHRAGLDWVTNNNGVHLQVIAPGCGVVADLWPTTGRWINRETGRKVKSGYYGATELIVKMNLTKE